MRVQIKREHDGSYKPRIFCVKVPRGEDLFHLNSPHLIGITEHLSVKFDGFERSQTLQVSIRNRSKYKMIKLKNIEINQSSVKLSKRSENVAKIIPKLGVRTIEFDVEFVSGIAFSKALLKFHFDNGMVLERSIQIYYRPNAPIFRKSRYEVPTNLVDLISKQKAISQSSLMNILDEFVPTVDDNYREHFHNLLFLKEAGMQQEIIDKYSQKKAFFNDTEYTRVNSKDIRRKYKMGHYDLTVHDLYETRPSLQLGMALCYSMHNIRINEWNNAF